MEVPINQLALTSSNEEVPLGLSGDPNRQPRIKPPYDPRKYKAPPHFIARIYTVSISMLIIVVVQWSWVAQYSFLAKLIFKYNYYLLLFFFISFIQLLVLVFFHDVLEGGSRVVWYLMFFTAMETSSTVLITPLITVFEKGQELIYTAIALIGVVVICILFSMMRQLQIEHTADYVIVGGIRIFMMCSVGNLISQTTSASPFLEVAVSLTIIPFITCFILVCAKTIGTANFYQTHARRIALTALSSFYCYMSLYANLLTFFLNIDMVHRY